jgi:anti-anti-sigma regulatory factor
MSGSAPHDKLSRRRNGDVTVVDVDGGTDLGSRLVDLVVGVLDEGERRIVLNLRGHRFDSNALGQATGCWLKTNHRGGVLKIATHQPKVWELIRILKLDRVIDCYRSEQEAIESFALPPSS